MADEQSQTVVALVRDLMFMSRIMAAARTSGAQVQVVRDPQQAAGTRGRLLIADLNLPGAVEAAAAWKQAQGGRVIGFVSHVDAQTIARAREAGLDHVLARGAFVAKLPEILQG